MVPTRLTTIAVTVVLLVSACGGNRDERLKTLEQERDVFCTYMVAALKETRRMTEESRRTPSLTPSGVARPLHHAVVYCSDVERANDMAWQIDDDLEPSLALAREGDEEARKRAIAIFDRLLEMIPARLRPEP